MRTMIRTFLSALLLSSMATAAYAGDVSEVTKDDYYGYGYYQQALEHPKIAKQKTDKAKVRMVARDMRWKSAKLQAAIDKVSGLDGEVIPLATQAAKDALEKTRVKGRIINLVIDPQNPNLVVMYVRWRGTKSKEVVKEASAIASAIAKAVPLVSTISLAAIHPKSPADTKTTVWQAKISASSAANISESRIDGFADRLYKRLFEEIEERPF